MITPIIDPVTPDLISRLKPMFTQIGLDMRAIADRINDIEHCCDNQTTTTPAELWPVDPVIVERENLSSELPSYLSNSPANDLSSYQPVDIKLSCQDYNLFDLSLNQDADLAIDNELHTAIIISLFTDRYDPQTNQGGYWGDDLANGDILGSRLWLLKRAKPNQQTLLDAEAYATESLQWMLDDGLVDQLTISASLRGRGQLTLTVDAIIGQGSPYAAGNYFREFGVSTATSIQ